MPYIKTRSVLSPVFNDEYQIFEWLTTPPDQYIFQQELWLYNSINEQFPQSKPELVYEAFSDSYKNQVGLTVSYFSRFTTNSNKYLRQFTQYTIPTGTFSSKFELENFDRNLILYETDDYLFENDIVPPAYDVTTLVSYVYYGWDYSDSNDISNFHLTNYRSAYGSLQNPPAPTQSLLFTDRPLVSDMAEINFIPLVLWQGNGNIPTKTRFHIAEYNLTGSLATYSVMSFSSSNRMTTRYLKMKKASSNISYVDIWVGATASNLDISKQNAITQIYRLENKCKSINDLELATLIFQNKFGTFDSFDFIQLQSNYNITKGIYDSSINLEINKSIPIVSDKFPGEYTKSRTTDSRQARVNNIKHDETKTITTNNINREQLKWLEDLILSENVYEWRDEKYIPINIVQNSIVVKPINNIFSQLTLSYNYSQKRETR